MGGRRVMRRALKGGTQEEGRPEEEDGAQKEEGRHEEEAHDEEEGRDEKEDDGHEEEVCAQEEEDGHEEEDHEEGGQEIDARVSNPGVSFCGVSSGFSWNIALHRELFVLAVITSRCC